MRTSLEELQILLDEFNKTGALQGGHWKVDQHPQNGLYRIVEGLPFDQGGGINEAVTLYLPTKQLQSFVTGAFFGYALGLKLDPVKMLEGGYE